MFGAHAQVSFLDSYFQMAFSFTLIYDYSKNKKTLEISRKQYFKRQIGNEEDVKLIEESIAQSINYKLQSEKINLKKNDKLNRIKKSFE